MIEDILERLRDTCGDRVPIDPRRMRSLIYTNRGLKRSSFLAFIFAFGSSTPCVVLKLSQDIDSIEREFGALQILGNVCPEAVPQPYLHGRIRGVGFFAMHAVVGRSIARRHFDALAPRILDTLFKTYPPASALPMSPAGIAAELLAPLQQFDERWGASLPTFHNLFLSLQNHTRELQTVALPQVSQHGDFCLDNLLVGENGRIVIIDWEDFGRVLLPTYDVVSLYMTLTPFGPSDHGPRLAALHQTLSRYAPRLQIDERWLEVLVPVAIMRLALAAADEGREDFVRLLLTTLERISLQKALTV